MRTHYVFRLLRCVQTGEERDEMIPCSYAKRRILRSRGRPVYATLEEILAHCRSDEISMQLCEMLALRMRQERSNVSERAKILNEHRIEEHVLDPKIFAHAQLRIELAGDVFSDQFFPECEMICRRDAGTCREWAIEMRRIIFAGF